MAIEIIKQPDVYVTESQLARYRAEYQRDYMYSCFTPPTLEEYIRRRQQRSQAQLERTTPCDPTTPF